jgi:hypothetical protein
MTIHLALILAALVCLVLLTFSVPVTLGARAISLWALAAFFLVLALLVVQ